MKSGTIKAIERPMTLKLKTNAVQPSPSQLVMEWQRGPETFLGLAQTKLRLAFAPAPATATATAGGNHS
jgi:hypothetical protein